MLNSLTCFEDNIFTTIEHIYMYITITDQSSVYHSPDVYIVVWLSNTSDICPLLFNIVICSEMLMLHSAMPYT